MEIPAKVSFYCPLVDAKGTPGKLVAVSPDGYYQLEVSLKGRFHTMLLPMAGTALIFSEPEPEVEIGGMEIER